MSGILKDDAITLLRKFYTSENPRGIFLSCMAVKLEPTLMVSCCSLIAVEDSKKKRKKRSPDTDEVAANELHDRANA